VWLQESRFRVILDYRYTRDASYWCAQSFVQNLVQDAFNDSTLNAARKILSAIDHIHSLCKNWLASLVLWAVTT
jgi:hypothetical protein